MTERKIICKMRIGSHLYGTSRPDSDEDFQGVFLPSESDLLGLQNCPGEMSESVKVSTGPRNEKGDVDCKFYSLQKFINLAGQGQPGALEMLFAPAEAYISTSDEWSKILDQRDLFLSRKSVSPFIGFALAQAHKTSLKGDNLKQLENVLAWGATLTNAQQLQPLRDWMVEDVDLPSWYGFKSPDAFTSWSFELRENDHHFSCLWIAGRQYDPGAKTKVVLSQLKLLVDKYGTRSRAAAEYGLDYKSLMHAYRLIGQAEELLATGKITLPRPPDEVVKLLDVRAMNLPVDFDWHSDIVSRLDNLRQNIEPTSPLQKEVQWDKLSKMCTAMLKAHLKRQS